MPHKPPICPAYAQSQCLTLSPIAEVKSRVNSPVLSCKSSLFSGFEWTSANAISPLMAQAQAQFSNEEHVSPNTSDLLKSPSITPSAPTSMIDKLEQLNIQQQQSMPGISSILAEPTPVAPPAPQPTFVLTNRCTSKALSEARGLGINLLVPGPSIAETHRLRMLKRNGATTPCNTPARPAAPAPAPIQTKIDLATIEMKLNAVGDMPLTPPYDEDEALTAPIEEKDIQQQDNEDNDDMPLDTWLQFKMEEAKRREEFERESAEVLMNTSPASIVQGKTEKKKKKWSLIPSDDESSSPVKEENDKELSDHEEDDDEHDDDAIIVTQGKRISLKDTCVIATLKRRSRLMNLHKEAGASVEAKDDGLPSQEDDEMKVDEFGMRIEGAGKVLPVDEAEVAMNEDRTLPKYSIFSPTSRLPHRRSVSFAKPEVTDVKTFNPSPLASKSHKRKASTSSLFTINSTSEATSTSSSTSKKFFNGVSATNRSGRSFSTSAIPLSSNGIPSSTPTFLDHNGKPCPAPPVVRHKRARRSSSIVSSLAFTSNSLVPILSSAFLKTNNNDNRANSPNNKNKEEVTHTSLRNVIGGSSSSYSTSKDIKLGDKDDLALYKEEKENQAPTGAQEPCDPRKITTQHLISLGKMRSITFIPGRNKSNLRSIHKPSGRVWTVPPLEKDTKTTP